jgi:putative FmdB family regulatory protein
VEISFMPIYEYDCPECGRFEVLQKRSDAPLTQHDCGKKVKKLMSASAFAFKGSGFYATDYKKSSSPSAAPACERPKGERCSSCPSSSVGKAAA